jgi:hypothetical protein
MKKTRKLTAQSTSQIEAHIRGAAQDSINVQISPHAKKRMRERKLTLPCVFEVLRKGRIRRTPEPNTDYGTLECRMEFFSAGHNIGVVVAISDDDPAMIVVTTMHI